MSEPTQATQTETETQTGAPAYPVHANFDNTVELKDFKFHFKSVEDKETGLKSKRPTMELKLPIPSVEGAVKALEAGGKQLDLVMEALQTIIVNRAREIISEDENITAESFPYDQLTWEVIANLPEAERRGRGIPKEIWEAFAEDYVSIMPGLTGKSTKQVQAAADILLDKFNKHKTNKKVIKLLQDQLAVYVSNSPNAETYTDCISFLNDKATRLMNQDESSILDALGA